MLFSDLACFPTKHYQTCGVTSRLIRQRTSQSLGFQGKPLMALQVRNAWRCKSLTTLQPRLPGLWCWLKAPFTEVSTGLPLSNSQVWTLRRLLWNPPRPLLLETWTRRCRVGKVFPAAFQKIMDDRLIHHGCAVWVLVVLICDFKTCLGILGESGGGWRSCTKINWCKVNQQR